MPFRVRLLRRSFHDGPHFDRARLCRGNAPRNLDGVVQVFRLDQVVSAELLLRFGVGAIGGRDFSVPRPHSGGSLGWLELVRSYELAALLESLGERSVVSHVLILHVLRERGPRFLVVVNKAKVFHSSSRYWKGFSLI